MYGVWEKLLKFISMWWRNWQYHFINRRSQLAIGSLGPDCEVFYESLGVSICILMYIFHHVDFAGHYVNQTL